MAYGMSGHLGISFQDSFGTAETGSMDWIPLISESLVQAKPPLISEGMKGRYEEGDDYEGPNEIAGDIVFNASPILVGKALKAWCGQSSATLQESVYSHGFKPITSDFDELSALPPMTIEVYKDAGSAHQFYDCLCDALTLEVAGGEFVKVTMGVLGRKFEKVAKSQPSYLTTSEYVWNQSSLQLGGAAIDEILNLSVTCANALEGRHTLDGSKDFNRIKRGGYRTVEIAGTILFVDDTEFDIYRAQTKQRLVLNVAGQAVSSGYPGNLEIDVPSMKYSEFPPNISGLGLIEVGFTASARYNVGSAGMILFTCVNTVPGYGDY